MYMLMQKETKHKRKEELNLLAEQMMTIKKKSKLSAKTFLFAVHDLIIMSCALSTFVCFIHMGAYIGIDVQVKSKKNLESNIFMRSTKKRKK